MRSRTRKLVAVPVLWAGLTAVSAAAPAAVEAGQRPAVSDDASSAARTKGGRGLGLVTAAPAPVHGIAPADGSELNGTFVLRRFLERRGVLYADGTLTGTLGSRGVDQRVLLPVTGASNPPPAEPEGLMQPVPTPGACEILTLALGPLDLNLLGLRVALDEVNLLIEAIPGAGNLLGNLLCAVAGLLDGGLGGGLGGLLQGLLDLIADLLNGLLGP